MLNRHWSSFIGYLDDNWWGSVSEDHVSSFLSRPDVKIGAVVVAACWASVPGGLCSFAVKQTDTSIQTCNMVVQRGRCHCTDISTWERSHPLQATDDLMESVENGHLIPKPQDVPEIPNVNVSVTGVVEEMRDMITSLEGAWWGTRYGCYTSSPQHCKVLRDLQRMNVCDGNPAAAAAVCYRDKNEPGYLFDIVTAKGNVYDVNFDSSGFNLGTVTGIIGLLPNRSSLHFSNIRSLLQHMNTSVTFVTRPFPTLQELCRDTIVTTTEMKDIEIPPHLKDFVRPASPS